MTDVFVGPSQLAGAVTPPPSKSVAHRALILSALAEGAAGMASVKGISRDTSQDLAATMECMASIVASRDELLELNCRESGSTLRFLLPVAAALGKTVRFRGATSLALRPLRHYSEIMDNRGVKLEFDSEIVNLPVTVSGQLKSGEFLVPGHISSQYITGLMLALPMLEGDSRILLTSPLQSRPYVELTQTLLREFGVAIGNIVDAEGTLKGWSVPGRQKYQLPQAGVAVETDYSQAAFWLAAAFLGHDIAVRELNPSSVQGDRVIVALLAELATWNPGEEKTIDAGQIPDLVPILAVVACQRPGRTVVKNAARLRLKESDRLRTTSQTLTSMGAQVAEYGDGLIIEGVKRLKGGQTLSFGDHRIVMAAAIAALNSREGVLIKGADAVDKSYPHFFQELRRLGGDVRGI